MMKFTSKYPRHPNGQFYASKHEAIDQLVRSLPSADLPSSTASTNQPPSRTLVQRRTMARIAVNLQDIVLPPGKMIFRYRYLETFQ